MRKLFTLFLSLVLILSLVIPTFAAQQVTLYPIVQGGTTNYYRIVEYLSVGPTAPDPWPPDSCIPPAVYEGIVCNRTIDPLDGDKCIWDNDDSTDIFFGGSSLKPGEKATWTHCLIGGYPHIYGMLQGQGQQMTLIISIELNSGISKTISTTGSKLCLQGPGIQSNSPILETIPNSDGGVGVPGTISFTVRNDTNRTERWGIRSSRPSAGSNIYGAEPYDNRWCPSGWPVGQTGEEFYDPTTGISYAWSN